MKFEVFGPIEMPKKDMRANDLRKAIDARLADEPRALEAWQNACGCYVFAIATTGGARPWYVGKTTTTFRTQCLTGDKPTMYRTLLGKVGQGNPHLYLVAQVKPTHSGFAKPNKDAIDWLETRLIAKALDRNERLENHQKTKKPKTLEVEGFMGSRRARGGPAKSLRKVFGE